MTLARLGSKPSTGRLCMLSKRAMTKFLPKLASTLAMLVTAGCSGVNSSDRFDWKATESAPKNFPIEIISGTFFYHGQSGGSGLYIPSGGIIHKKGWGEMVSSHIVGPDLKPLPDKLHIKYFSYLEDQFYEGNFDLPYEKIVFLFREGSKDKDNPEYNRIMVGVAPGGSVAVWLTGRVKTTEVFFGRADLAEGQLMAFGAPILDREAEVKAVLEDRKSTRLNSSHVAISYAVFCLKKKNINTTRRTAGNKHWENFTKVTPSTRVRPWRAIPIMIAK